MMESSGSFLQKQHLDKTFIRNVIKTGCCSLCWATQGHNEREVCLCKGFCRECCSEIVTLPHKGFHHACQSFITSTPDHRKLKGGEKRPRQKNMYDVGTPTDASQLQYTPSESSNKRAKLAAELQVKRQKREADQARVAAEAATLKAKEDAEKAAAEAAAANEASAMEL